MKKDHLSNIIKISSLILIVLFCVNISNVFVEKSNQFYFAFSLFTLIIGLFYEADKNAIDKALENGQSVAGTINEESHAVLIIGHDVIDGKDYYDAYDVVDGLEFQLKDLNEYDHLHILKEPIK